jgi:hypothetical protein
MESFGRGTASIGQVVDVPSRQLPVGQQATGLV